MAVTQLAPFVTTHLDLRAARPAMLGSTSSSDKDHAAAADQVEAPETTVAASDAQWLAGRGGRCAWQRR